MALAFHEDVVARCRRSLAEQHLEKTAAGHFVGRLQTCSLEEGGGQIGEIDEVIHLATRLELATPANRERYTGAGVVAIGQAPGHLPTVVAGVNDEGFIEEMVFLQFGDTTAGIRIHATDGAVVGEEVGADGGRVGQLGRHLDGSGVEARPAIRFVAPFVQGGVGIAAPKEEGLRRVTLRHELGKIFELSAHRIFGPAKVLVVAW